MLLTFLSQLHLSSSQSSVVSRCLELFCFLFRTSEHSVHFSKTDREQDVEAGSQETQPSRINIFRPTAIAFRKFRKSRHFEPSDDVDSVQKKQLSDYEKVREETCWSKVMPIALKTWSFTSNILIGSFDSGTDTWIAKKHYQ